MTKNEIIQANETKFSEFVYQNKVELGLKMAMNQNAALLPRTLEMERIATAAGFYVANSKGTRNDLTALSDSAKLKMIYGMQKEAMVFLEAGTDYDIVCFKKDEPTVCRNKMGWYKLIDMIKPAEIVRFVSNVATTGDELSFNPVTEEITHKMSGLRGQTVKDIIGAYAYIKFANGFEKAVFWDKSDITHSKSKSSAANGQYPQYSPWNSDSLKMVETKVIKELAKKLFVLFGRKLSPMMQGAALVDDTPIRRITTAGAIEVDDRPQPEQPQYNPSNMIEAEQEPEELNIDELPI